MFKIKITLLSLLTCFTLLSTAQVCASENNESPLSDENQEIKEDSTNDNVEVSERLNSFDEQKKYSSYLMVHYFKDQLKFMMEKI